MFWSANYLLSKDLKLILQEENVSLTQVLEAGDILQECKANNPSLIQYLTRPEILSELISLITEEPQEADKQTQYRFANVACEVLTSHVNTLKDKLSSDSVLMNRLCDFLNKEPPLNPLLASFFSQTVEMLLARSYKEDWCMYNIVCLRVLDVFRSRRDFLPRLLSHLATSAIADTCLMLLRQEDSLHDTIMQWIVEEHQFLKCLIQIICGTYETEPVEPRPLIVKTEPSIPNNNLNEPSDSGTTSIKLNHTHDKPLMNNHAVANVLEDENNPVGDKLQECDNKAELSSAVNANNLENCNDISNKDIQVEKEVNKLEKTAVDQKTGEEDNKQYNKTNAKCNNINTTDSQSNDIAFSEEIGESSRARRAAASDNAARLLCELIEDVDRSTEIRLSLISSLRSPRLMTELLQGMFCGPRSCRARALVNGGRLLRALLADAKDGEEGSSRDVEYSLAPHLPLLHQALLEPHYITYPSGSGPARRPAVGAARLELVRLVGALASNSDLMVAKTLVALGTLGTLLELWSSFPDHSFLQGGTVAALGAALDNRYHHQLYWNHLFVECDLATKIMDAFENSENRNRLGHTWSLFRLLTRVSLPEHASERGATCLPYIYEALTKFDAPIGGIYPTENCFENEEMLEFQLPSQFDGALGKYCTDISSVQLDGEEDTSPVYYDDIGQDAMPESPWAEAEAEGGGGAEGWAKWDDMFPSQPRDDWAAWAEAEAEGGGGAEGWAKWDDMFPSQPRDDWAESVREAPSEPERPLPPKELASPYTDLATNLLTAISAMCADDIATLSYDNDQSRAVDSQSEVNDNQSQVNDNRSEVNDNQSQVNDNRSQAVDGQSQFPDTESKVTDDISQIAVNQSQSSDNRSETTDNRSETTDNRSKGVDNESSAVTNESQALDSQTTTVDRPAATEIISSSDHKPANLEVIPLKSTQDQRQVLVTEKNVVKTENNSSEMELQVLEVQHSGLGSEEEQR